MIVDAWSRQAGRQAEYGSAAQFPFSLSLLLHRGWNFTFSEELRALQGVIGHVLAANYGQWRKSESAFFRG